MVVCYLLDTGFMLNFEANKIIKILKLDWLGILQISLVFV